LFDGVWLLCHTCFGGVLPVYPVFQFWKPTRPESTAQQYLCAQSLLNVQCDPACRAEVGRRCL